jgi:hypothetical protein
MTSNGTNWAALQSQAETAIHLLDDWFDPIEAGLRDRVREFIQAMIEALPPQNASGNWVKVVQRLPVRVRLLPH